MQSLSLYCGTMHMPNGYKERNNPMKPHNTAPLHSTISQMLDSLRVDGHITLSTGHRIEILAFWGDRKKEPVGLVRVHWKNSLGHTDHKAKSIQIKDLQDKAKEVIQTLFKKEKSQ